MAKGQEMCIIQGENIENKGNIPWYPETIARNFTDQNMVYITANNLYFKCLISKDT